MNNYTDKLWRVQRESRADIGLNVYVRLHRNRDICLVLFLAVALQTGMIMVAASKSEDVVEDAANRREAPAQPNQLLLRFPIP